jgi:hypothetical protein
MLKNTGAFGLSNLSWMQARDRMESDTRDHLDEEDRGQQRPYHETSDLQDKPADDHADDHEAAMDEGKDHAAVADEARLQEQTATVQAEAEGL